MAAGKIVDTALWEMSLTATGTLTDDGDDYVLTTYRSEIYTRYSGLGGTSDGIRLTLESAYTDGVADTRSVGLKIPDFGIDVSYGVGTFAVNQTAKVEIDNLKVYVVDGFFGKTYFTVYDELRLYWNGGLEFTHNPSTGILGTLCTPTAIPLFGEPPSITGGCGPGIPEWNNWATSEVTVDLDLSGSMSTTGGWRFKDAGGLWLDFPVAKPNRPGVPSGSPYRPSFGGVSATSTSSGSVTSSFRYRNYGTSEGPFPCDECPPGTTLITPGSYTLTRAFGSYDFKNGRIMLFPACTRSIARLNDDYMGVWWRGGFPYTDAFASTDWYTADRESVCADVVEAQSFDTNTLRIHSEITGEVGTVLNSGHKIEDALGAVPYAPFSETHAVRDYVMTIYLPIDGQCDDPNQIPHVTTSCCPEEPHYNHETRHVQSFPVVGPRPITGFVQLTSDDEITKYVNYWGSPHWSYFYFFPQDTDPLHWWCQGAKRTSAGYWMRFRQQWASGSFLTSGDQRRTRNFLISAPLADGALAGHWANYMGVPTSPVGICRPDVIQHGYPEQVVLDSGSEPNFSGTDCTLSFGSDISVTVSASPCVIELDLSSFDDPPYFAQVPAGGFTWDIGPTNVSSVSVQLVNAAGDVIDMPGGTSLANVSASRPKGEDADSEWAGSHAQDFADAIVDDEGVDIESGGTGTTVMGSPERVHDFQYLAGREATLLRFTVTNTGNFSMEYPKFHRHPLNASVYYETGTTAAQLFGRTTSTSRWGAGFRWGQWNFWDDASEELRDTPSVRPAGETPTVLDWLCYRNLLNGVAHDDDLATDIAALYDALEGQALGNAATNRYAFLQALPQQFGGGQPGNGYLVNSWREVPPVPAFPHALLSGGHGMTSYSFAQESRFYVHPNKQIHYEYDYGSGRERFTSGVSGAPDGWFVTSHRKPLTSNEVPADGYLVTDEPSVDWANHAPYNGIFIITAPGQDEHSGPWCMVDFQGRYHAAQSGTGEIIYRRARQIAPLPGWDFVTVAVSEPSARNPRMAQDSKTLRIFLVFESDSGCREVYSDDDGRTWSSPADMAITGSPVSPTIQTGDGGVIRAAVVPGTPNVIGATWQGPGDQSQSAQFTFKDTAAADLEVEEGQFHLAHSGETNDRWLLEVVIDGESSSSSWWSADNCRTWTRFA